MKMAVIYKLNAARGVAMGAFAVMVVALAATQAGAAIVATDDVEQNFFYSNSTGAALSTRTSGEQGLATQVGTNYVSLSASQNNPRDGAAELIPGFGAGAIIAPGTYTLSAYAGDGALARISFTTFEPFLKAADGTELAGRNETASWVAPALDAAVAGWQLVTVEYTVAAGDPTVGQEFTWGFNYTKVDDSNPFYAGFDGASVDFVPVPEPASLALLGLGTLSMLAVRRRRVA